MTVFLTILKIIGIILLCILLLAVALVLTVLFIPVKYSVEASYDEKPYLDAKFSWLFHIISGKALYESDTFNYRLKIFGKTVLPKIKKEKANKRKKNKKQIEDIEAVRDSDSDETVYEEKNTEEISTKLNEVETKETETDKITDKENLNENPEQSKNEEQDSLFGKLKVLYKTIYNSFINIKYSLSGLYDKIKKIGNDVSFYLNILQEEKTKRVLDKALNALYKVFKNVKPKKFVMKLHLGFKDSPDIEGQVLAIYGLLYPFHEGKIELTPDFETDKKEAFMLMKGKMQFYVYIRFVYLYLFDKDVKELKEIFQGRNK